MYVFFGIFQIESELLHHSRSRPYLWNSRSNPKIGPFLIGIEILAMIEPSECM